MKIMDCVEVIAEKEKYARYDVHKGMQGWICWEESIDGTWLVNFPGYGENADIAEIPIKEEDLMLLPNGFNSTPNEKIKENFENNESK